MADTIKQRATAYKLRVGDILSGKPILEEERLLFVELGNKQIVRVNIVANIVEKYESEGEKKFISLTLDDASGQLKVRIFQDVDKYKEITQGSTVMVVGVLRFFNNEVYLIPEIMKIKDPRYLLVRKLELEAGKPKEVNKEEIRAVKDQIIELIKSAEDTGGIGTDRIIMEVKATPEIINQEIQRMLEEGLVYEPRPGKIRYLG